MFHAVAGFLLALSGVANQMFHDFCPIFRPKINDKRMLTMKA